MIDSTAIRNLIENWVLNEEQNPIVEVLALLGFEDDDIVELKRADFSRVFDSIGKPFSTERIQVSAGLVYLFYHHSTWEKIQRTGDTNEKTSLPGIMAARVLNCECAVPFPNRRFPRALRDWHASLGKHNPRLPHLSWSELTSDAVATVLDYWARYILSRFPDEIVERSHVRAILVVDGLFSFLDPDSDILISIDEPQDFYDGRRTIDRDKFVVKLRSLVSSGFGNAALSRVISRALLALCRVRYWPLVCEIVENLFALKLIDVANHSTNQLLTSEILSYWVRASTMVAPHNHNIAYVCDWILNVWAARRPGRSSQRISYEQELISYGQELWALHALIERLNYSRSVGEVDLKCLECAAKHLEGFSSRMAFLRFEIHDENPNDRKKDGSRLRCSEQNYKELFDEFNLEAFAKCLSAGSAFLGLYDIPSSGHAVALLVFVDKSGKTWVGILSQSTNVPPTDFRQVAKQYTTSVKSVERCTAAHAVNALSLSEFTFVVSTELVNRTIDANNRFGELIDKVIDDVETQGAMGLGEADLILAPRGTCAFAAPELLGRKQSLLTRFQSISYTPSARAYAWLKRRAGQDSTAKSRNARYRISVSGWLKEQNSEQLGSAVFRLRSRIAAATIGQDVDVTWATDNPTVREVSQLIENADCSVLLGHGSSEGLEFYDGFFPGRQISYKPSQVKATTILLCSCLSGQWSQSDSIDALSPITEAASIDLAMGGRLSVSPTCIGAFTMQVHDFFASELIADLLKLRLNSECSSEFAFARSQKKNLEQRLADVGGIDSFYTRSKVNELAKKHPAKLLAATTALCYRILGCESSTCRGDKVC